MMKQVFKLCHYFFIIQYIKKLDNIAKKIKLMKNFINYKKKNHNKKKILILIANKIKLTKNLINYKKKNYNKKKILIKNKNKLKIMILNMILVL